MNGKQKIVLSVMLVSALMVAYLLSPRNGLKVPARQVPAQQAQQKLVVVSPEEALAEQGPPFGSRAWMAKFAKPGEEQASSPQAPMPAAPSMMSRGELLDKAAPRSLKPGMSSEEKDAVRARVALAFQELYNNLGLKVDIYTWGKDPKALKIMYSKMNRNVALSFTKQFNENPQWMQALRDAGFERVILQNVSERALRDTNLRGYLRPNDRPFSAEYKVTDEGLVASRPSPTKVK
jgi:hypothetical protein